MQSSFRKVYPKLSKLLFYSPYLAKIQKRTRIGSKTRFLGTILLWTTTPLPNRLGSKSRPSVPNLFWMIMTWPKMSEILHLNECFIFLLISKNDRHMDQKTRIFWMIQCLSKDGSRSNARSSAKIQRSARFFYKSPCYLHARVCKSSFREVLELKQ